jgi:hypothetical protein
MAIFSLIAKLGLDGSAYESGLKRASSVTDKFRSSVGAQLGSALSVAAIGAFASKVIETADAIGDLSEQLNISTDDVQRLQVLASQTGVSFESMAKSITAVSQERLKAVEEGGKSRAYFKLLGINVADLNKNSISNIEIITRMSEAHKAAGSSAQTQAAMIAILGEKAFKAAGAIAKIREQGEIRLINQSEIDSIGRLSDSLDELKRQSIVAAAPEVSYLGAYVENLTAMFDILNKARGNNLLEYWQNFQAAVIPAMYINAIPENAKSEALPLINQGRLGTIDSRAKRETSMFSTPAPPGWANTLMGQIKIQTNETRAIRVNTGRTAQAVE